MNIYLIRHGKQNTERCNEDLPLNELGRKQAALLGERMARYDIDGLYSSNLIRAVETAQIAYNRMQEVTNGKRQLEHVIREGLREFDFGDLTSKPDAYVKEFYQNYNELHTPFDGDLTYPGGESGKQVSERMMPVIKEIAASGKENVMVVSHGGAIRALLSTLFSDDPAKRLLYAIALENCSITQLYYDDKKQVFYLERFNDYAHLEVDETLLRKNRR